MEHTNIITFIHKHIKPDITDSDYGFLPSLTDFLDTLTNMTYKAIYVIDYNKGNFLYISDSPIFLGERARKTVLETGLQHYEQICDKNELSKIEHINSAANLFWSNLPPQHKREYSLTYNFHINGKLIHHKMCPIKLDRDGNIWLTLCTISLANNTDVLKAYIIHEKSHAAWKYNPDTEYWTEKPQTLLDDNEKNVLAMSYAGMTIEQISKRLCKSVESVKKYRQSIFSKLGTTNITESIACAISRCLF